MSDIDYTDKIQIFKSLTNCNDDDTAINFLSEYNWDEMMAVNVYFSSMDTHLPGANDNIVNPDPSYDPNFKYPMCTTLDNPPKIDVSNLFNKFANEPQETVHSYTDYSSTTIPNSEIYGNTNKQLTEILGLPKEESLSSVS